jgi:hypothetical protein
MGGTTLASSPTAAAIPKTAQTDFLKAIAIDPEYEPPLYEEGLLRFHANDVQGAISYMRRAVTANRQDACAHWVLGLALTRETGPPNDHRAANELRAALKLYPALLKELGSSKVKPNEVPGCNWSCCVWRPANTTTWDETWRGSVRYRMLHTTSTRVVFPPRTVTGVGAKQSICPLLMSGLLPVSRYVLEGMVNENGSVAVVVARQVVPEAFVAVTVPGICRFVGRGPPISRTVPTTVPVVSVVSSP